MPLECKEYCPHYQPSCEECSCEPEDETKQEEPDYIERPSDEQMESYKRGYRG